METERWHRSNVPAARVLRSRETRSERALWARLRNRGFHRLKFRRQHPVGPFVLDFYCEDLQLAIEIDGAVHGRPDLQVADANRQQVLESLGIRFFRVSADATERDIEAVLLTIERALGFA